MAQEYTLKFTVDPRAGAVPNGSFTLGHRTAILGANGTGKSRLLAYLAGNPQLFASSLEVHPIVYLSGGRAIPGPKNIEAGRRDFSASNAVLSSWAQQVRTAGFPYGQRIDNLLQYLLQCDDQLRADHSDAVNQWSFAGRIGEPPARELRFDRLRSLFESIISGRHLKLRAAGSEFLLEVDRSGWPDPYSARDLSDGEKQILALLLDVIILSADQSIVLVDEPELSLHPHLACRFWDRVEAEFPNSRFVYATHCLPFAMRASIDRLIVLGATENPAVEVATIGDLVRDREVDLRAFLGAAPGILLCKDAVFVEGDESSFDSEFYAWVMGSSDISVQPVGDCHTVRRAANGSDIWKSLASHIRLRGVIDRDFRSDDELLRFRQEGCICLELHEAESYLCDPVVVIALAKALGLVQPAPESEAIEARIVDFFAKQMISIAANRVAANTGIRLNVSVSRNLLTRVNDVAEAKRLLCFSGADEVRKASQILSPSTVESSFDVELARCSDAVKKRDVTSILRLCPGKELLFELSRLAGCRDAISFVRGVSRHLSPNAFSSLRELAKVLE